MAIRKTVQTWSFEVASTPMKVGNVTEWTDASTMQQYGTGLDSEETD
jgi:hypothetical protein